MDYCRVGSLHHWTTGHSCDNELIFRAMALLQEGHASYLQAPPSQLLKPFLKRHINSNIKTGTGVR
eukprot:1157398-Pelagomonas_calceolata.AAC.6